MPNWGKEKFEVVTHVIDAELEAAVREYSVSILEEAVRNPDKKAREARMDEAKDEIVAHFAETYPDDLGDVKTMIEKYNERNRPQNDP